MKRDLAVQGSMDERDGMHAMDKVDEVDGRCFHRLLRGARHDDSNEQHAERLAVMDAADGFSEHLRH